MQIPSWLSAFFRFLGTYFAGKKAQAASSERAQAQTDARRSDSLTALEKQAFNDPNPKRRAEAQEKLRQLDAEP